MKTQIDPYYTHTDTVRTSQKTACFHYKNQSVDAVYRNNRYFCQHETEHTDEMCAQCVF